MPNTEVPNTEVTNTEVPNTESTALVKPVNDQLPAFLQTEELYGEELMGKYVRPPRLKIIQPLARELYSQFNAGDIVLTPQLLRISEYDRKEKRSATPFYYVPLFFYPEWCVWNPLEVTDEHAVSGRSFDPKSEIAVKAQSPDTWAEPHHSGRLDDKGHPLMIRYVEHLNFIVAPIDPQYFGMQVAISYFRGEMRTGTTLCSIIKMRNAPLCAQIFRGSVVFRTNAKGQWYGLDSTIPTAEEPQPKFIEDPNVYSALKAMHESFKEAHASQGIQVDFEETLDVSEGATKTADETEF